MGKSYDNFFGKNHTFPKFWSKNAIWRHFFRTEVIGSSCVAIVSSFKVVSWCVFVFPKLFIFCHFWGHEFWPIWQHFLQNPCVSTGHNFFLGHFTKCHPQPQIVPLVRSNAYVKFQVVRSSLSKRLCAQISKLHYQWKWFWKVSDFFYFDNFLSSRVFQMKLQDFHNNT